MTLLESRRLAAWLTAVLGISSGCANEGDEDGDDGSLVATGSTTGTGATATTGSTSTSGGSTSIAPTTETSSADTSTSSDPEPDTGESSTGEPSSGGSSESGESPDPALPDALALRGCEDIGVGPLCTITQDETSISANCAETIYTGEIDEDGNVQWTAAERINGDGAAVNTTCEGRMGLGMLQLTCLQTISATDETEASETMCQAQSAHRLLPNVGCMELPAEIESFTLCEEGEDNGSITLEGETCRIVQDDCNFQLDCGNDLVVAGTVNATGVSFRRVLPALADAEMPEEGEPAFLAGAEVSHRCSASVEGTRLTGSCTAGAAGRGGTNTSVCAVTGAVEPVDTCELISPAGVEQLFVLDSCPLLEEGESPGTGIGEPICAFRQNNCIWEVHCGQGDALTYSGRLERGETMAQWNLATGTPCKLGFDDDGNPSGSCMVAGEEPCALGSKDPDPGNDDCPTLPSGTEFYSHGCGGGDPLDCRVALQNGCDYMAVCGFARSNPSVVFAGETLYDGDRPRFEFNGLADYACYVDQATAEEISSGERGENEWHGQCTNAEGGQCRDNYDPETGEGYRGLRLFFEPRPEQDA